jgi:hypothetical protein
VNHHQSAATGFLALVHVLQQVFDKVSVSLDDRANQAL